MVTCEKCGWQRQDPNKPCLGCMDKERQVVPPCPPPAPAKMQHSVPPTEGRSIWFRIPLGPGWVKPYLPIVTLIFLAYTVLLGSFGPRQWGIIPISDDTAVFSLTELSAEGWMVVSARRCVDNLLSSDPDTGYEVIVWRNHVTKNFRLFTWLLALCLMMEEVLLCLRNSSKMGLKIRDINVPPRTMTNG